MLITFRRGTRSDARAGADLWLRARKAAIGTIPKPGHDDYDVRAWFASHVICDSELWVAEDRSDTVVGILVLDGQWLDQLYVEPTLTGHGIGAGLVEVAKRERPQGLQLWTFESNAGAQRFYERLGSSSRAAPTAATTKRAPRTSCTSGPARTPRIRRARLADGATAFA